MTRSGPLSYLLDNSHEAVDLMRTVAWKVVAKGGDDASAGQMREHGLWLVSLDARFRIEAIQFRPRE